MIQLEYMMNVLMIGTIKSLFAACIYASSPTTDSSSSPSLKITKIYLEVLLLVALVLVVPSMRPERVEHESRSCLPLAA
jgi:hypothetical protein